MIPHEIEINKIAVVTVILSILLSVITITIFEVSPQLLPLKAGVMMSAIGLLWFVYDKYLWKIPIFRVMGWLCSTPNLNGRWEGTVDRDGENTPHPFVMEISQTMTKLKFYTYTKRSKGESIAVKIVKDELDQKYKLIAYWRTRAANREDDSKYDEFNGVSVIDISFDDNGILMSDFYFTDRNPHTRGKTDLKWVGVKTIGRFK
ncbi:hypothetical protein A5320_05500 [Rheinheimera sp. SA_1]|uniref:Cap15 family cyclic dinucleotide receptor domain-containing protein n=1 Tax=Rheinheimera sp. SA_1 TaxID=1827365 RepID=UPI0007FEC59C|nr:hypothetical protein [Rheinheimera sp. SA_1]OBP16826.1 hypothetical protein A5320_05500 [Rheinheimera sp. SA_1]